MSGIKASDCEIVCGDDNVGIGYYTGKPVEFGMGTVFVPHATEAWYTQKGNYDLVDGKWVNADPPVVEEVEPEYIEIDGYTCLDPWEI